MGAALWAPFLKSLADTDRRAASPIQCRHSLGPCLKKQSLKGKGLAGSSAAVMCQQLCVAKKLFLLVFRVFIPQSSAGKWSKTVWKFRKYRLAEESLHSSIFTCFLKEFIFFFTFVLYKWTYVHRELWRAQICSQHNMQKKPPDNRECQNSHVSKLAFIHKTTFLHFPLLSLFLKHLI